MGRYFGRAVFLARSSTSWNPSNPCIINADAKSRDPSYKASILENRFKALINRLFIIREFKPFVFHFTCKLQVLLDPLNCLSLRRISRLHLIEPLSKYNLIILKNYIKLYLFHFNQPCISHHTQPKVTAEIKVFHLHKKNQL